MGHSQSYDLRNPEVEDKTKDPVRGVRRVSKEHRTDTSYSTDNTENFDYREEELREKIRNEQLIKREAELESMRIRQHESREPIIDAYRTTSQPSPSQTEIYREFNYYDSLKHPNPVDPSTYFQLRPRKEVNGGSMLPLEFQVPTVVSPDYSIPKDPKETPRYVPPMSGTYSKRTVTTTYSYISKEPRATVIPQYDTVPSDPVTWRAPHYDEVPVVREVVPTVTQTPARASEPELVILERFYRAPEVSRIPLESTVTSRNPVPYRTPKAMTPVRASEPEPVPIPVKVTPVKSPEIEILERFYRTPEVSRIPLESTVTPRNPVPYRTPKAMTPVRASESEPVKVIPVQSTELVILERFYRTPEVPETPLAATVTPRDPVPYRIPGIPLESSVTPRDPVPYEAYRTPTPTTPVRAPSRVPTPLDTTLLTREVDQMPLATTVIARDPVPYNPYSTPEPTTTVTHNSPVPYPYRTPEYRNIRRTPTPEELFQRHPEVPGTPLEHHVAYSNYGTYSTYRTPTPASSEHLSEIHAEKRMVVGIEPEPEKEQNVSYVTVADFPTYSPSPSPKIDNWPEEPRINTLEQLHKQPEVLNRPIYVRPSQSSYQSYQPPPKKILIQSPPEVIRYQNQETQYSRRPSEDGILELSQKPKKCEVENCSHVEVRDSPVAQRRSVSEEQREKENHLQIYIDEKEMEGVVDLARDEDVGTPTSTPRRCYEEKLHYNSYFPTLSLGRRPIVSFYDKLH